MFCRLSCPYVDTVHRRVRIGRRPIIKPTATAASEAGRRGRRPVVGTYGYSISTNAGATDADGRTGGDVSRGDGRPAGRCVQLMLAIVRSLIDGCANAARSEPFNCCLPAAAVPLAPHRSLLHPHHSLYLSPSIHPSLLLLVFSLFLLAQLIILYKAIVRRAQLTGWRSE